MAESQPQGKGVLFVLSAKIIHQPEKTHHEVTLILTVEHARNNRCRAMMRAHVTDTLNFAAHIASAALEGPHEAVTTRTISKDKETRRTSAMVTARFGQAWAGEAIGGMVQALVDSGYESITIQQEAGNGTYP
jgi:hypothetical protein